MEKFDDVVNKNCFIVAHRGNSAVAPENTLAAFRSAWENGVKYVETDVYQTCDNYIICCHDNHFKRVSPGADDKFVRDMTIDEVKSFDVGSWKDAKFAGEKVPTLDELFAILPKDVKIFLEIKSVNDDFPMILAEMMKKYGITQDRIVIISFKEDALLNINKFTPGFKTQLLLAVMDSEDNPEIPSHSAETVIQKLTELGVTGIDCRACNSVNKEYIQKVKAAGFEFHVWTVDSVDSARRFYQSGVDSITSNCPTVTREILN